MPSTRRPSNEMEFGSDSFMDVVANVVGILIILIVLAGIRVGSYMIEHPPQALPELTLPSINTPPLPTASSSSSSSSSVAERLSLPQPGIIFPVIPEALDISAVQLKPAEFAENHQLGSFPDPQHPEQKLAADQLKKNLARLQAQANQRKVEFPQLQTRFENMQKQLDEVATLLSDQQALGTNMLLDSKAKDNTQQTLALQLEQYAKQADILTNDINLLSKEILDRESKKPLPQTLGHKVTPVGKAVEGDELHFRIINNRIAYLPIKELSEDLKRRIIKNRQALLQTHTLEGTVGPVSGFSMKYLVSLQDAPVTDQLRSGSNLVRIGVDGWEIIPEKEPSGETEQQAFQRGSLFDTYLANAGNGTTITLWIYPESFPLARKIQTQAQKLGFRIAARPLPDGVPIVGSPSGSKSIAQ